MNLELVAVWSPPAFTGGRIIQYHVNFTSQVNHVYHTWSLFKGYSRSKGCKGHHEQLNRVSVTHSLSYLKGVSVSLLLLVLSRYGFKWYFALSITILCIYARCLHVVMGHLLVVDKVWKTTDAAGTKPKVSV